MKQAILHPTVKRVIFLAGLKRKKGTLSLWALGVLNVSDLRVTLSLSHLYPFWLGRAE